MNKKKRQGDFKLDTVKHSALIEKQKKLIDTAANNVKTLFNKGGKVTNSKEQKELISKINDLMFSASM
jgi:hypothetical protein